MTVNLEHNMSCMCTFNDKRQVTSLCLAHEEAFRRKRTWVLDWLEGKLNGAHVQWVSLPKLVKELRNMLKY